MINQFDIDSLLGCFFFLFQNLYQVFGDTIFFINSIMHVQLVLVLQA